MGTWQHCDGSLNFKQRKGKNTKYHDTAAFIYLILLFLFFLQSKF